MYHSATTLEKSIDRRVGMLIFTTNKVYVNLNIKFQPGSLETAYNNPVSYLQQLSISGKVRGAS